MDKLYGNNNKHREHWGKYVAGLEYDAYGHQDKAFKILKDLNKETKDNID
jgi:hypothetical protein